MRWYIFLRVLSFLVLLFSFFMVLPIIVAIVFNEQNYIASFAYPAIAILICAGIVIIATSNREKEPLNLKIALMIVPISWLITGLLGCLPFIISGYIPEFSAAFFETVSGLTTTGATILTDIESLPRSLLFWRALTHWLGGIGIVVMTVAIFPLLGIEGTMMLSAEASGPTLNKITPKITQMAKVYWLIYATITFAEVILLMMVGMSWFDAFTHSFATIATGGFSTYNASIAAFQSPAIEWIIAIFMMLSGINFALYFAIVTGNLALVYNNSELRLYLLVLVSGAITIFVSLLIVAGQGWHDSVRAAFFTTTSIMTTTGFISVDYELWPSVAQTVIFLLMFIGGCAGSTGGGIKVIRTLTSIKYVFKETTRFFYPLKVKHIKINKRRVEDRFINSVMVFVMAYFILLLLTTMVLSYESVDIMTAFSSGLALLGNIGPGFGGIGPVENYAFYSDWAKIFASLIMIMGRLEIFSVIIMFSPSFWKRL